jgi:hypothetical protein
MANTIANTRAIAAAIVMAFAVPAVVCADGFSIEKVYHPYVQPLEREIEVRSVFINDDDPLIDGLQGHRLGFGKSFTDRLFAEFYFIGIDEPDDRRAVTGDIVGEAREPPSW